MRRGDKRTMTTIKIKLVMRRRIAIHSLSSPRGEKMIGLEAGLIQENRVRLFRRYTRRFGAMCALTFVAILAKPGYADSLFPIKKANAGLKGSTASARYSLLSDVKARNVGDLLTVTVSESTSAKSQAETKAATNESVSAFAGTGLFARLLKDFALTANNSRNANGSGQTTRTGSFTTTLAVIVKEVLPNGILKIEGIRSIQVNKETQKIGFSGLVRPEDITGDNSVPSFLIAQVELIYQGKGMIGDTQHPGILTRIFRFIF